MMSLLGIYAFTGVAQVQVGGDTKQLHEGSTHMVFLSPLFYGDHQHAGVCCTKIGQGLSLACIKILPHYV